MEIDRIATTTEFLTYLSDNNINPDDYYLNIITPTPQSKCVLLVDGNKKYYYEASNSKSINSSSNMLSYSAKEVRTSPNCFTIHNSCGRTVYYIGVNLFVRVAGFAVGWHRITRWNLSAGGVLHYNPDPDYTHVNLSFKYDKSEWFDTVKWQVPLGTWHHAYMCRNTANGKYWRF
ncbi:MAG: hypothetical protein PHY59_00735 [Methanobacterium sp.]|nr:hypothetical protein [Methanobacterium sp.]